MEDARELRVGGVRKKASSKEMLQNVESSICFVSSCYLW